MTKALFLDRDGTINVDYDYVHTIEKFEFIEGIFELCRYYQDKGYAIFVVTNQSGIARGKYNEADLEVLHNYMFKQFHKESVTITKAYFCPHHPNFTGVCECRKPKPGMLFEAQAEFNIDLPHSVMIGDKERDIQSALAAGVQETYLYDASCSIKESSATKIIHSFKELYNLS